MATLGRIKTHQMPWHANMTELNHLGLMLHARPTKLEGKMNQLFSTTNYYADNPMSSIAFTTGSEKTITSLEWEWEAKGASTRPLVVVENVELSTNTTPGQFRTTFKIKLDESWYVEGDVIDPGTSNKRFQCRIMENPMKHGNGWIYKVRLVEDNPQVFLPVKYLQPGQQWTKLYSTYGEGAQKSGSTQYSSTFSLSDRMSKFRKHFMVTDYASSEVLAVKIQDRNGNMQDTWLRVAEVEYWQQWYRELERAYWYNRSNDHIKDSTGRPIRTFSGIQQKLEDSHLHYYTHLTAKLIEEYLMDIYYSRTLPGGTRKIKVFTGEYGMLLFSRAMQDLMEKRGWAVMGDTFSPIEKASSPYHSNAYSVGYQFVKYKMHNGAELELVHNPLYDDRTINFELDEITGKPVESMRFTFLDFSGNESSSNVQVMAKKNGYSFGYVAGLYGPTGPTKGGNMAHAGEYYEMHVSKVTGIHMEDITKCGELILKRN